MSKNKNLVFIWGLSIIAGIIYIAIRPYGTDKNLCYRKTMTGGDGSFSHQKVEDRLKELNIPID